uniref:Abasic site processing protein HMCES n=1 Tax=Equus caballus TaxID=9796 RepID=A0A9L0T499_HORSE
MCGRISCHLPRDVLTRACAYRNRQGERRLPEWRDADKYCPSYNKSPRSSSPVLLSRLHFEKQLKARGCSHRMLQWLARNSPTKEDPKTPQKTESDVRQFLPKSPSSVKRSSAVLLEQWLKQEKEEEPVAKQLHSE